MKVQFETNVKGFKVLHVTSNQCYHWGGACVCDHCGNQFRVAMYIAVLNEAVCISCYSKWDGYATYYPEDAVYEQRNAEKMERRLQDYNED